MDNGYTIVESLEEKKDNAKSVDHFVPLVSKKLLVNKPKKVSYAETSNMDSAWPQEGEIGEGPESEDDSLGYKFFWSVFFFFWLHNMPLCTAIKDIPYLKIFSPCFIGIRHVPAFVGKEYALLDMIKLIWKKLVFQGIVDVMEDMSRDGAIFQHLIVPGFAEMVVMLPDMVGQGTICPVLIAFTRPTCVIVGFIWLLLEFLHRFGTEAYSFYDIV
ncbi:hypothetical protein ARMGADRAFT_1031524 [Armillaria gallica]|uniref:Uncharacterized protein n=1 Tax=Armillaria gallica TaxID=47427 RepID=A0A2H3DSQ5_ARMGA|nr:hypothetical protein ARMGADRAFT_1031524 [Armillaria gallica]